MLLSHQVWSIIFHCSLDQGNLEWSSHITQRIPRTIRWYVLFKTKNNFIYLDPASFYQLVGEVKFTACGKELQTLIVNLVPRVFPLRIGRPDGKRSGNEVVVGCRYKTVRLVAGILPR